MIKKFECKDCPYSVFRRVDNKETCNFISAGTGDIPPCSRAYLEQKEKEDLKNQERS